MPYSAIAIECIYPDSSVISCSGIKLSKHCIISHGTLVSRALEKYLSDNSKTSVKRLNTECVATLLKSSSLKFRVYENLGTPKKTDSELSPHQFNVNFEKNISFKNEVDASLQDHPFKEATILHHWFYSELSEDLMKMMPPGHGWKLSENESLTFESETLILSSFVLLCTGSDDNLLKSLHELMALCALPLKGHPLVIESSPFGTVCLPMFFNSLSKGIISNVSKSGRLFLTDARSIYGCEGAPAYMLHNNGSSVCGFVLTPFCWLHGEWLGLTLMCSAMLLLKSFSASMEASKTNSFFKSSLLSSLLLPLRRPVSLPSKMILPFLIDDPAPYDQYKDSIDHVAKCLVSIECMQSAMGSSTRGTGFIVNGDLGIIVTCAHVIESTRDEKVMITDFTGKRQIGQVLFKSKADANSFFLANEDVWDIALVVAADKFPHYLTLSEEVPLAGTSVLTGGFGLFDPSIWGPFFSFGIISKVLEFATKDFFYKDASVEVFDHSPSAKEIAWLSEEKSIPVYLQTTCDVYGGTSGGPVISLHPETGIRVIGVITCSASESTNKIKFPNINLAACPWLLTRSLRQYINSKDKNEFDLLHLKSKKSLISWNRGYKNSKL